jgi:hypothetical protein
MPISKPDAETILEPYRPTLYRDIRDGVMDYFTLYSSSAHIHSPRTKANIRRDHVVARIKASFEAGPNIAFIDREDGLFLFVTYNSILNQSLAIRFKKLDPALHASNIPTMQAAMFDDQDQQLEFPEMPPRPTFVNAGYTLNKIGTAAEKVYITCPNGPRSLSWIIRLDEETTIQPMFTLPIRPITGLPSTPRVHAKGESNLDQEGADESGN